MLKKTENYEAIDTYNCADAGLMKVLNGTGAKAKF